MEITVYLYNFSKRQDSTARPAGGGMEMKVVWESPYDVVNPTIELRGADTTNYNYAYIPEFGERYYWATPSRYRDSDHVIMDLHCDVLATYRPQILSQQFYVELSQTAYNSLYKDSRIAMLTTLTKGSAGAEMPGISENSCNQYYIEAIGVGTTNTFTNKYILSPDQLGEIATKALTDPDVTEGVFKGFTGLINNDGLSGMLTALVSPSGYFGKIMDACEQAADQFGLEEGSKISVREYVSSKVADAWDEITSAVMERFKNPWDCIVTIKGLAIPNARIFPSTSLAPVYLGVTNTEIAGRILTDTLSQEQTCTVAIPWQYRSADNGILDIRNCSPYTTVNVILPGCNVVKVSNDVLYGSQNVKAKYKINATSGEVLGYLMDDNDVKFADFSFNISTNIALAQVHQDMPFFGTASDVISAPINFLGGNGIGAADNIVGILTPDKFNAHASGLTNMCNILTNQMQVEVVSNLTQGPDSLNVIGRPCHRTMTLPNGYNVCRGAHANLPATRSEIEEVDGFLNGGIYVE